MQRMQVCLNGPPFFLPSFSQPAHTAASSQTVQTEFSDGKSGSPAFVQAPQPAPLPPVTGPGPEVLQQQQQLKNPTAVK